MLFSKYRENIKKEFAEKEQRNVAFSKSDRLVLKKESENFEKNQNLFDKKWAAIRKK